MKKFMISISLPEELDEHFWTLIPAHRDLITDLMQKEIIVSYSINQSRTVGWIVMNGDSTRQVMEVIKKFPIYSYYVHVDIDELFLYDATTAGLPKLVMN